MVTQVTPFTEPVPNPYEMTSDEFESSSATLVSELNPRIQSMNLQALEVNEMALNVEVAAGAAANAKWVSGTYAEGAIVWSPTDYLDYRCKNAGSRTIDPVLDPTNWALRTKTGVGGSDTTSSAVDITLTSASGRLQIINMTAPGKKVTAPAATTLNKGAPVFVLKNSGQYRFAYHKNGGAFVCYIQPGQIVAFNCSDTSTSAGIWHAKGQNLETIYDGNTPEVLNAVDSRNIAVAMLTSTKAICVFRNNATGFLCGVILNYGAASGSPVAINGEASEYISVAAQTSNQATVVYKTSTGVTKGYVLDISSNTITPGTVATIDGTAGGTYTSIVALGSTKLFCAYQNATAGTVRERVLDIASSVITPSAEVAADATAKQNGAYRVELDFISSTKTIVAFKTSAAASITVRLQTVSVSTPAPSGSALVVPAIGVMTLAPYTIVVLSTDRAVLIYSGELTYADMVVCLLDISGTTPILLSQKKVLGLNIMTLAYLRASKLDSNNLYVTWNGGGSGGADSTVIRITSNDKIMIGNLSERIEPGVAAAEGYVTCVALDSTHVMQVCRNASTFLSAKTIEIAA